MVVIILYIVEMNASLCIVKHCFVNNGKYFIYEPDVKESSR